MAHLYRGRDITLAYDDSIWPSPRHPRDGWNARLEARNYLLEQPPFHPLQIPKSSRPCLYPGFQNPIISTPCEWQRAAQFYNATVSSPHAIPGLKIAAPACAGRDHVSPHDLPTCKDFSASTALNAHSHGRLPLRGEANVASPAQAAILATVQAPAVAGVKFNIDRDSELRQRTRYDPTDVCGLCDLPAMTVQSGAPGGQWSLENNFATPTPAVFWNVTRQRNLVGQVRIPIPGTDRVQPSCCGA